MMPKTTLPSPTLRLVALAAILAGAVFPGCTPARRGPAPRETAGAARASRDGIWALVPADTDWMLLAVPGALPRELVGRFPSLAEAGPCREGPPAAVLLLHGVRGADDAFTAEVRLFDGARAGCVPEAVGAHRQHPVLARRPLPAAAGAAGPRPEVWEVWSPRAWVRAPEERARYLIDRAADPDAAGGVEPVRLRRAVAAWRPAVEGEPALALWFAGSPRVSRFLRPLFPEVPLRGGLLVFFSDGWVRLRVHLEFADSATAEDAVARLRDGIISTIESGNYPRLNWRAALAPLVVHPEGSLLWVQWSMPVARALPLVFAVAGKGAHD